MIKVIFSGKDKTTSSKDNITRSTQVKWNEHLFLESGFLKQSDIEEAQITIQIQNKGFFKSETIGAFSISAKTIYQMKDHVVHNQPVSFTNPEAEDKTKIVADLSVSINIQGPGDEASQLKIGTDPKASKRKPWMPASVHKQYK